MSMGIGIKFRERGSSKRYNVNWTRMCGKMFKVGGGEGGGKKKKRKKRKKGVR